MGRELRRVALDFDFPIGETWTGFLNPHYKPCAACGGKGETASLTALSRIVSLIMLAGTDSLERTATGVPGMLPNYPGAPAAHSHIWPHPYLRDIGITDPGTTMHELTEGLAGRPSSRLFGHDACDRWSATRKIIAAAGLPEKWGWCPACDGECIDPSVKAAYDAWEKTDPPAGEGYQIWQTVSEGGPVSPVFATPEGLAHWMSTPGNGWNSDSESSYETWLRFITGPGWAPSMMCSASGVVSGVEGVSG